MSIYFLKITPSTPHSSDYEPNSTYLFFAFGDDDDDYIYFSVQQCTVMRTIIIGFHFNGYSFCVLHVVLKHFRVTHPSAPYVPQLKSCGPY